MKRCHYCAEEIQDDAIKCKHCGEWIKESLSDFPERTPEPNHILASEKPFHFWRTFIYSATSLVLIFSVFTWLLDGFGNNFVGTFLWIVLSALLIGILATYFIRGLKNGPKLTDEDRIKYNGLEGWLTLVILGLIVGFGYNLYYFYEIFNSDSNGEFIIADILIGVVFLVFNAYVIYLFLSKKRIFLGWYVAFLIISMVLNFVGFILTDENTSETESVSKDAGRSIISVMIWVPYMIRSKRVRATFIK